MERLRHVARAGASGPVDAAIVVAETVEALARLRPEPAELVNVCRQLVQRHPACGPLWWLGAHLLSGGIERLRDLGSAIDAERTELHLAAALPDGATVVTIGCPDIAARGLARRGDVRVLAVDAGAAATALVRLLDRAEVAVDVVDPAALVPAVRAAELVLVETTACSAAGALTQMGGGVLVAAARAAGTPVWLAAGRGTRLPGGLFEAAVSLGVPCDEPWLGSVELVPFDAFDPARDKVAGPEGVVLLGATAAFAAECPFTPELVPTGP